jgi:predicted  nucleic acid-binding Zn-ribbon protein
LEGVFIWRWSRGASMKEEIERLLALHALDRRVVELEKDRAELPEERARAEAGVRQAKEELRAVEQEAQKTVLARKAAEGDLAKNEEAIGRLRVQLNLVKTQREYDALLSEIAGLARTNDGLEETILLAMESMEGLEGRKAETKGVVARLEAELGRTAARVDVSIREVDALLADARSERGAAASKVGAPLLARYERIRSGKEGSAVARVEREACEVCYRSIPPQLLIEIRKMEKLVTCEGCGRILV